MLNRLWKRAKRSSESRPGTRGKIASVVNVMQHRIADQLQQRSDRLSIRAKKVWLALFVAFFGGISVWITWQAVTTRPGVSVMNAQPETVMPAVEGKYGPPLSTDSKVSTREYLMVVRLHRYLDSLSQSEAGRQIMDSLLRGRPGLRDSLLLMEKLYTSGTKQ